MSRDSRPMTLAEKLACVAALAALFAVIVACNNSINIKGNNNVNMPINKNTTAGVNIRLSGQLVPSNVVPGLRRMALDMPMTVSATNAPLAPSPGRAAMAILGPTGSQANATVLDTAGQPFQFGSNVANFVPQPMPNSQLSQYLNTFRPPPPGFQWYVFEMPVTFQGIPNPLTINTTCRLKYDVDPFTFPGPENACYAFLSGFMPLTWQSQGGDILRFTIAFGGGSPVPALSTWGALIAFGLFVLLGGWALLKRTRASEPAPN